MKSLVFEKPNVIELKDIPMPEIGEDEVLVKVRASGICHSDFIILGGEYIIPFSFPVVPGHEWSGEVVEAGAKVKNFQQGDRVVGECVIGCGVCRTCQEGQFAFCTDGGHFGFTLGLYHGACAEYLVAKPEWLHKIPADVDYLTASMIEPFSVAYNGINGIGGCDASDTVVIIGGGPIGLCAVAAAKTMGARVILVSAQEDRRAVGEQLNADYTIDPKTEDSVARIKELTDGYGADLVVECTGATSGYKNSLLYAKNAGRVSVLGHAIDEETPVQFGNLPGKGIRVQGFNGSPYVWEKCITFLKQGKVDLSPISTHQFKLEDAEKAYAFAGDRNTKKVKVTVVMD